MPIGRHLTRGPDLALHLSGPLLAACWLIGWYEKDVHRYLVWFFYIPPVMMIALGAAWLAHSRRLAGWPARVFVIAVMAMALCKITFVDTAWNVRSDARGETLRLVQWNTARRHSKAPEIFETLSKDNADLCVISEPPRVSELAEMGRNVLGMYYLLDDQGMVIFSRHPLTPLGGVNISNGRVCVARIRTPKGELDIMAVDVISHPLVDRARLIRELAQWVAAHDRTVPLIVAGDFNTMQDALAFDPLRQHLRNAYEVAGRGWPYSWPVPIPVYAIDHVWVSANVTVARQARKTSPLSDHRRQLVDFSY